MYTKYACLGLKQHYHINVDSELRSDCQKWEKILSQPEAVSRPFMDFKTVLQADVLDFYTDASGNAKLGFGCVFADSWTFGQWEENFIIENKPSIDYLELYAVTVAIDLWAPRLENRRVVIFCDNQAVVGMINKSASPVKNCMVLIRHTTLTSIQHNVRFFPKYVKSAENTRADALSRLDFKCFWNNSGKTTNSLPTLIPEKLAHEQNMDKRINL